MIEKIKKYFTSISKVCVLEQITFEGKTEFNYLEVSIVNSEFKILKQETVLNIESFKKLNSNKLPVVLNVNGYNVLTKVNPSNVDAFENDNFIFSTTKIKGDTYCNIVRSETILNTINYLNTNDYILLDIYVGAFNIIKYQDLLMKNDLKPNPHSFSFENELINYVFQKKDSFLYKTITIDNNEVSTNLLSPLASGLDYILNTQFDKKKNEFSENRNESVFAKLMIVSLKFFIGVLLLSLLINYAYQNHLSSKYKDSEYKAGILENKKNQIETLKQEIQEKERIFNDYGLSSNHQFTEYIDVIGSLRPNKLTLHSLNINPLKKEMKEGKKTELFTNVILLSGTVDSIEELNKFLINIENHILYNKAKIVKFTQESSFAKFKLEIKI